MSNASTPETLAGLQAAFTAHIRNPACEPLPDGVEDRRMGIYRELFFNNICALIAGNFPVLRKLYSDHDWQKLIREFYVEHRAQTPLFPELPKEFLRYVQEQRQNRPGDPAFLLELAHYEWVELALSLDLQDLEQVEADPQGDLLREIPVLSPLAWPLSYRFPVHRIRPDFQPVEAPDLATHLLIYRNRQDEVRFMLLNDVARLLLTLMQQHPHATGLSLLEATADQIKHPQPSTVIDHGTKLFQDLLGRHVLLGTRLDSGASRSQPIKKPTGG